MCPGFPARAEGVGFPGYELVHVDCTGVQYGPEHGAPNFPLLEQRRFFPQGEKVPRDSIRHG